MPRVVAVSHDFLQSLRDQAQDAPGAHTLSTYHQDLV